MRLTDNRHQIPLSVGYSISPEGMPLFSDIVKTYQKAIGEVYFAFPYISSGRSPFGMESGYKDYNALNFMMQELTKISAMGIKLDLLLNSTCDGEDALSLAHERQIVSILDFLAESGSMPQVVTTSSPVTAEIVHRYNSGIDVRASVNMRIGSVKGIQYIEHLFDSFCICRDINRCPDEFDRVSSYLKKKSKGISMLVNSGCLRNCSMQSFHDNVVAHETGIHSRANLSFAGVGSCKSFFSKPENRPAFLQNTWIRPEDVHNFKDKVDSIKVATRMHALPAMVIDAYARGSYHGNLADLFEPGHGPVFAPYVIDNDKFPSDWFTKTTKCNKYCLECNYCNEVCEKVFVNSEN